MKVVAAIRQISTIHKILPNFDLPPVSFHRNHPQPTVFWGYRGQVMKRSRKTESRPSVPDAQDPAARRYGGVVDKIGHLIALSVCNCFHERHMVHIPLSAVYTFVGGFVQNRNVIRVLGQSDSLSETSTPNSTLLKFLPNEGSKFSFHLTWMATKIIASTVPQLEVITAGPDGRVNVGNASGDHLEQIEAMNANPGIHGVIRDLRIVGRDIVAVGMGRQAYRRKGRSSWEPFHHGVLQVPDLREVRGFNAVHGVCEDELVAVGWYGEIYRWTKLIGWVQEDSGTNLILNDVHMIPNGTTYACGQNGVLLMNANGTWQQVARDVVEDEIRSLQWFDGKLYMVTDNALLAMDSRGDVVSVSLSTNDNVSFNSLHASDGVLLSVGPKDIYWTNDTKKWNRLD